MSAAVETDHVGKATTAALIEVAMVEDPVDQLKAIRALLDRWREGEDILLLARREMVEKLNPYLSYSAMADALGCSKANIHQIRHPKPKAIHQIRRPKR